MVMRVSGWKVIRLRILERDGYRCMICGQSGADSVDHIVPRVMGGSHADSNLRAAHFRCNSRRGAQMKRRTRAPNARESRFG